MTTRMILVLLAAGVWLVPQGAAATQMAEAAAASRGFIGNVGPPKVGIVPGENGRASLRPVQQKSEGAGERQSSRATGIVSQVNCAGGVKIQLDTPEGTRTLRIQTGTPFRITAPTHVQANLNPCTSLKGLHVTVQFIPDDEKGLSGAIERVEILPADDAPKANSLVASPRKEEASKASPTVTTTSEGTVNSVKCDGKELLITLAVRGVDFKLHSRNFTRLEIEDEAVAFQTKTFDPCTQLNGKNAIVTYVLVEKKSFDGEIMAIEVGH